MRFNYPSGKFMDFFVPKGGGGLGSPFHLTFGAIDWKSNLLTLLDKLRTLPIHANPLWDPLRDLITRPPPHIEIENAERFATTLMQLVRLLKTQLEGAAKPSEAAKPGEPPKPNG